MCQQDAIISCILAHMEFKVGTSFYVNIISYAMGACKMILEFRTTMFCLVYFPIS